jgi:putative ABC transport system ATP-binding protein
VWENVILPLELAETGFLQRHSKSERTGKKAGLNASRAHAREQAASLLDAVGLLDRRETFPDRLSGGQQQRVAIARALVHDPLLVLADEPTGNLDEETGKQVLDLLDRLTRQRGKNLILVTHSAEAAGYADRVLHLKDGKFLEQIPELP